MEAIDRFVDVGFAMHVREWQPLQPAAGKRPFLLVHGLASNARTWDAVGRRLALAGHWAIAIDQRGHGLSDKLDEGYDFTAVTQDIHTLLDKLGWAEPILAGQSWGGNVMLAFGARYPGRARQLIFVDGGFLHLQKRGPWETVSAELRPPQLNGTPRTLMKEWLWQAHPQWSEEGVEATLGNFEDMADGTIRPWLTLARHMQILRAMYDQDPTLLYGQVQEPVLLCVADEGGERAIPKREWVETAVAALPHAEVTWFAGAAHDIHVDRPDELTARFLQFAAQA
ncbi:MAG: alpha/beta hydrolase [Ardenticatenaceae bacterium]|nr:alpha/beta hydrolase [Ardenticatenaceae bacterium]